jgi:hypothetical protein
MKRKRPIQSVGPDFKPPERRIYQIVRQFEYWLAWCPYCQVQYTHHHAPFPAGTAIICAQCGDQFYISEYKKGTT